MNVYVVASPKPSRRETAKRVLHSTGLWASGFGLGVSFFESPVVGTVICAVALVTVWRT